MSGYHRHRRRGDERRPGKQPAIDGQTTAATTSCCTAVYGPDAPGWLTQLPAVDVLRVVLLQNYVVVADRRGREVVKRREADTDGLPPGRSRVTSSYDTDARRGGKRDLFWTGYKVHISETRTEEQAPAQPGAEAPPNIITNVATSERGGVRPVRSARMACWRSAARPEGSRSGDASSAGSVRIPDVWRPIVRDHQGCWQARATARETSSGICNRTRAWADVTSQ